MGKKPLISSKTLLKIETLLLILFSFFLLHFFDQKESVTDEKGISFTTFKKKPVSVFFDEEISAIEKFLVRNAKNSIKAATYTFSETEIQKMLDDRFKEGLVVKILCGKNRDNTVPLSGYSQYSMNIGIYHPKFFVFDSKDVLITSSNISSDRSASNSAVLFRDVPELAKILENEIDDVFMGRLEKRCELGCVTEAGTLYFNPGKGCMAIKKEFLKAERSIKAGVYTVTSKNPVITGIKNALKKGVKVSVMTDNWKGDEGLVVNKKAFSYLSSKGANLKFDEPVNRNDSLFHHKFAVVDSKTTIFGSMNWTSSGCYKNREIVLINHDRLIALEFEKYFDRVFNLSGSL